MTDARESGGTPNGRLRAEQRLERRVEERTRELTALLEVSRSLSSTLALEPLLNLILDQLLRVIDYRGASIIVVRDDMLETVASRNTRETVAVRSELGYTVPLARALPIWQAALRGEPVVIRDVRGDDLFARTWRAVRSGAAGSLVRSWLGVPLSARGQAFGFLALTRDEPDSFTGHEIELAVAFAGHAAVAIDNARLLAESEQRTRELTALLGVAGSLASTIELEPLLDLILDQLQRVMGYTSAAVITLEDGRWAGRAYRGPLPRDVVLSQATPGDTKFWTTVRRGEVAISADAWNDSPEAQAYRVQGEEHLRAAADIPRSLLNVPLVHRGQFLGALTLSHETPGYYRERHATLAFSIATQAAVAIENARLYERERRSAQELATLLDVARSAASTLELGPLLNNILDTLELVVDHDGASIGVVDGDEFRFLEARGASSAERRPEMIGVRLPMREGSGLWEPLFRHEPVIIADIRDDSAAAQAYRRTVGEYYHSRAMRDIRAFMAIPLVNRDRLVGLLTMSSRERDVFTKRHAGLTLAIATHIAAALENARLYDQTEQRAHELATLLEVSTGLGTTLELEPLLDVILEQLKVVADYRAAAISVVADDSLQELRRRTREGDTPPTREVSLMHAAGWWEPVARGESVIIDDVQSEEPLAGAYRTTARHVQNAVRTYTVRGFLAVPLTVKDRVMGTIVLSHEQPGFYTERHAALAMAIGTQAATAIENARLYGEAQRVAVLEERQRLSRELHDSVSQALFGIGLGARTARTLLQRNAPEKALGSVDYVVSLAEGGMAEMRALLFELRPESLATEGLVAALTKQAAVLTLRHELAVDTALGDEPDVSLDIKEALFRIAQEALHNIVKHARARTVQIHLSHEEDNTILSVRDDGAGFDPTGSFPGHIGQHSMRERAERLGGTVTVESAVGQGTCIVVRLP